MSTEDIGGGLDAPQLQTIASTTQVKFYGRDETGNYRELTPSETELARMKIDEKARQTRIRREQVGPWFLLCCALIAALNIWFAVDDFQKHLIQAWSDVFVAAIWTVGFIYGIVHNGRVRRTT